MPIRTPEVLLTQAAERMESGDLVSAGCHAREAIRRYLKDLCDRHGCRPAGRRHSPRELAAALERAGVLSEAERQWLNRLADVCHRASHLYVSISTSRMQQTIDATRVIVAMPMQVS